LYLADEAAHEAALEFVIVALRLPGSGVSRPDEPYPMLKEDVGIGP
jgi:hypothetical protein